MLNPIIKNLLRCSAGALVCLVFLYLLSGHNVRERHKSFHRIFSDIHLGMKSSMKLPHSRLYFAGIANGNLFFGSPVTSELLEVSNNLKHFTTMEFDVPRIGSQTARLAVDGSTLYVWDGSAPFIYKGSLNSSSLTRLMPDTTYFRYAVPLSSSKFALLAVKDGRHVLALKTMAPPQTVIHETILTAQVDGFFCTDGMMRYDRTRNRIIYTYYYRNEYLTLDTALTLIRKANTLDSISVAQVNPVYIADDKVTTLSNPPLFVNNASFTDDGALYIQSNLAAKNENLSKFRNNYVIDVYDTDIGAYKHSFYLPSYENEQLLDFIILKDRIYARYGDHLVLYEQDQ